MDPPLITDSTFSPAYSLAEIWPGMPHFPPPFPHPSSADHSTLTDLTATPRKRKDCSSSSSSASAADEDDCSKVLSSTTTATANLSNVIKFISFNQNQISAQLTIILILLFQEF